MSTFTLTLIVAAVVVVLGVFGMCFNIIFRRDGHFPEYEVGENREMRRLGIKCARQEEAERQRQQSASKKTIKVDCDESCSDCRQTECR